MHYAAVAAVVVVLPHTVGSDQYSRIELALSAASRCLGAAVQTAVVAVVVPQSH